MAFVHPTFLWALTALAVPVIIHLFQLRRFKRIDFPDVRLLRQVSLQTRQRRKVRHWLVLCARMLALAALVLAFAQPYVPAGGQQVKAGRHALSVFIDDSYSMDGTNGAGRLLDQARAGAQEAIMRGAATDRVQVITGRLSGRQQLLTGRDEALQAAAQVDVSPFTRPLSQVITRQREALDRSDAPVKRMILFTDLQRTIADVDRWTVDPAIPVIVVPLPPASADNLSIDSCWFASPVRRLGRNETLHVRVRNRGTRDLADIPLRLGIDGRQRALATFSVGADATVDTVLHFTNDAPGDHWGLLEIPDRPVTFDDRLYIAYRTAEVINVLLVSGGQEESDARVRAVFAGDSIHAFTTQAYRSLDLGALQRQHLVVLNALPDVPSGMAGALQQFVERGGSLAFFPADEIEPAGYNALLADLGAGVFGRRDTARIKVDRIDLSEPFFRDMFSSMPRNVDLPSVGPRHALLTPAGARVLLRLQDGGAFLAAVPHGRGQVYVCAAPLEGSGGTFTRHALYVTSLLRMAELSRPMGALYHQIGAARGIDLHAGPPSGDAIMHLLGPDGIDLVPELRRSPEGVDLVLHDLDLPDGPYAVVLAGPGAAPRDTVQTLALDLSRAESDLTAYRPEEFRALLQQHGLGSVQVMEQGVDELARRLDELDEGRKLWIWCVLLALIFLAAEVALLRLPDIFRPSTARPRPAAIERRE